MHKLWDRPRPDPRNRSQVKSLVTRDQFQSGGICSELNVIQYLHLRRLYHRGRSCHHPMRPPPPSPPRRVSPSAASLARRRDLTLAATSYQTFGISIDASTVTESLQQATSLAHSPILCMLTCVLTVTREIVFIQILLTNRTAQFSNGLLSKPAPNVERDNGQL